MKINLIGKNNSIKLKEVKNAVVPSVIQLEKLFKEIPENSVGNFPIVLSKNQTIMFIKKSTIDILFKEMLYVSNTPKQESQHQKKGKKHLKSPRNACKCVFINY